MKLSRGYCICPNKKTDLVCVKGNALLIMSPSTNVQLLLMWAERVCDSFIFTHNCYSF